MNGFNELAGSFDVTTLTIGGNAYALISSYSDDGLQIADISNPFNPLAVSSITDGVGGFSKLNGARSIKTTTIGDNTYALIASYLDSSVEIVDIIDCLIGIIINIILC